MFMPSGVAAAAGASAGAGELLVLVAGDVVPFRGYDISLVMGSLTPNRFNGKLFSKVLNDNFQPNFTISFDVTEGVVADTDSAAFAVMTLDGDFSAGSVQQVYTRQFRVTYTAGPPSFWTFTAQTPMINGRTYQSRWT